MFEKITPEEAGISSDLVAEFISVLEERGANTHSLLMMKGDRIFAEYYWTPYTAESLHRMYSATKSFVGIAIGFLQDEGKLCLTDPIASYFTDVIDRPISEHLRKQTIRDTLTMSTADVTPENIRWYENADPDRSHLYFQRSRPDHPSDVFWDYDSAGSQLLCALVEKLSGMPLLDYLKSKIFDEIGTFRTAAMLKTPSGTSWGDSAMLCTTRDMASFARFVLNYGKWNGRQVLSEDYVRTATSCVVDNHTNGHEGVLRKGYGYQIWRTEEDSFAFVGAADQLAICVPKKDLIFVITSHNGGSFYPGPFRQMIISRFMDLIVRKIASEPLRANFSAEKRLARVTRELKINAVEGLADSPFRRELSGKIYTCKENPSGITKFSFVFRSRHSGEFRYTNAQGDKVIPFGVNHNVFGKFPQYGYPGEIGCLPTTDGSLYDDAVSLAWVGENRLILNVQIIDRYLGGLCILCGFRDKEAYLQLSGGGEGFLNEYHGNISAKRR